MAIRIALDSIPPMLMGGLRWIIAGVLMVALVAARGDRLPASRHWPALALIGALMIGVGNGAVVWAEQTIASGLAAVLVAATPFWLIGLERLRPSGLPIRAGQVVGLLVGFAGIVLLVWPDIRGGWQSASFAGALATQLACLGWAAGSVYSRGFRTEGGVLGSVAFQMLFGGLVLLVAGLVTGEWATLAFTPTTAGALTYLVLVGSVAGYSAYAHALAHLPIATVSLYAYINPVIAVLLGTVVLSEPLSPRIVVAGLIVLAGMIIVRRA